MELADPQILNMIFVLPGLLGLSLFWDAMERRKKEERLWWLNIITGILVIVAAFILYLVSNRLYQF
jgi:Na+/melibiose symporter-like transporter